MAAAAEARRGDVVLAALAAAELDAGAREAAESARTVDHHLRNVFRTLGVRHRAEPARIMVGR